ncbi:MAG: hypothetical protein Q7T07_14645 [Burkholderiaceae bacterium]|nr:hypothetical protein [Burkholderiaceae bacterium]
MTSTTKARKWFFRIAGTFFVLACIYAFMGVLQAASLSTGGRAPYNGNLWGSLSLVFAFCAAHLFAANGRGMSQFRPGTAKFIAILWAAIAAWATWQVLAHILAVDRCLDDGASFDYVLGQCDIKYSHEAFSIWKTHGFLIVVAVVTALHSVVALRRAYIKTSTSNHAL